MRLYLLLFALIIANSVLGISPISNTIDRISYDLVKTRGDPREVNIFIPAVGYDTTGKIQVLVIAVPYSPNDEKSISLINQIIGALLKLPTTSVDKWGNIWEEVASSLKQLRNVYFPYEIFKIKLIFVIFVKTDTLMDWGLETVKDLINQGVNQGDKQKQYSGALFYASAILEIMSENKASIKFNDKIDDVWNEVKNSIRINVKVHNKSIGEPNCEVETIKQDDREVTRKTCTQTDRVTFNITGFDVTFYREYKEAAIVTYHKEWIEEDGSVISRSCTISRSYSSNFISDYKNYVKEELLNKKSRAGVVEILEIFKKSVLPSLNQLAYIFIVENDRLKEFSEYFNQTLYDYYREILIGKIEELRGKDVSPSSLGMSSDDCFNDASRGFAVARNMIESEVRGSIMNVIEELHRTTSNSFNEIDNLNYEILESFSNSLKKQLSKDAVKEINERAGIYISEIEQHVANVAKLGVSCVVTATGEVAKDFVNNVVSAVPVAGQLYVIANGIVGALQRLVKIEGAVVTRSIFSGSDMFIVDSAVVCRSGVNIKSLNDLYSNRQVCGHRSFTFDSRPSAGEVAVQAIIGFISGVAQTVFGESGEYVDLIPIIREVDVPGDKYFFMIPARPGVYTIDIYFDIKNIIESIKSKVGESINEILTGSEGENELATQISAIAKAIKGESKLLKTINEVIINSRIVNEVKMVSVDESGVKIGDQVGDVSSNCKKVTTFVVSFPPYAYGSRQFTSVQGFRYGYSYDWFGFFRPYIYDMFAMVRSSVVDCKGQGAAQSTTTTTASPSSSFGNIIGNKINGICDKLSNEISNYIIDSIDNNIDSYLGGILEKWKIGEDEVCSLRGIVATGITGVVAGVKGQLVDSLKSHIENAIREQCTGVVEGAKGKVIDAVNSLLGNAPFLGNVLGATGGSSGDGHDEDRKSLVCSLRSSLGYLASPLIDVVEDSSHLPSYLLAGLSLRPPESVVVRRCYSVVASPYFVYLQQRKVTITRENLTDVLLIYSEELGYVKEGGEALFEILKDNPIHGLERIWFEKTPDGKYKVCHVFGVFSNCESFDDLGSLFRSDLYNRYVSYLGGGKDLLTKLTGLFTFTPDPNKILGDKRFDKVRDVLSAILMDRHIMTLQYLGGVNTYFTAFKVYPAIAVRERPEDLNAYYMVIPYSVPARELFVLGSVGDYVIYDGEPKRSDNKPFLYVDLVEGSTR